MIPLDFPVVLPPNLVGKWRIFYDGYFEVDGVMKRECVKLNFEGFILNFFFDKVVA